MPLNDLAARLTSLLEGPAEAAGLQLVLVEVAGAPRAPIVRVYLDREGGIDIDAIAGANAWIKDVLDAQTETADRYTLEVSSPGIERPLRTAADFVRFAGQQAKVTMSRPVEGRKAFTGTIVGVEGDNVVLESDGTTMQLPLGAIAKARLRVEIDFNKEDPDGI